MNIFIIFVKFFGWIVVIWVMLDRFIVEKKGLRFWKGLTTKIKNIITKKKIGPWRGAWALRPLLGSSPAISYSISLSIYVSRKDDSLTSEKGPAIIN